MTYAANTVHRQRRPVRTARFSGLLRPGPRRGVLAGGKGSLSYHKCLVRNKFDHKSTPSGFLQVA